MSCGNMKPPWTDSTLSKIKTIFLDEHRCVNHNYINCSIAACRVPKKEPNLKSKTNHQLYPTVRFNSLSLLDKTLGRNNSICMADNIQPASCLQFFFFLSFFILLSHGKKTIPEKPKCHVCLFLMLSFSF